MSDKKEKYAAVGPEHDQSSDHTVLKAIVLNLCPVNLTVDTAGVKILHSVRIIISRLPIPLVFINSDTNKL